MCPRACWRCSRCWRCTGCGSQPKRLDSPQIGRAGATPDAPQQLGFPDVRDEEHDARGRRRRDRGRGGGRARGLSRRGGGTHPARAPSCSPTSSVWQAGARGRGADGRPLRAPLLLSDGGDLPAASADALAPLAPTGASELGGAQVVRVGDAPAPGGYRSTSIAGGDPFALAAAIDRLAERRRGARAARSCVASADDPAFAMPAAGWAAKSGDPLLFVQRDRRCRAPTLRRAAAPPAAAHLPARPAAGVVGAASRRRCGTRHGHADLRRRTPCATAIAFARFATAHSAGASSTPATGSCSPTRGRPLDAAAAAPLSASAPTGRCCSIDDAEHAAAPLGQEYLLDIQPGYTRDPVRGVYNHAWMIGDEHAISSRVQSRIDSLLEIAPSRPARPPSDEPSRASRPPAPRATRSPSRTCAS